MNCTKNNHVNMSNCIGYDWHQYWQYLIQQPNIYRVGLGLVLSGLLHRVPIFRDPFLLNILYMYICLLQIILYIIHYFIPCNYVSNINWLALITIKNKILKEIDIKYLVNDFMFKYAQKMSFSMLNVLYIIFWQKNLINIMLCVWVN